MLTLGWSLLQTLGIVALLALIVVFIWLRKKQSQ